MAKTKVDNKLNVVIGTKSQITGDSTISENSIVIITDEELKANEIDFNGTGTNYLASGVNVDGAIKTLDSKVKDNADAVALKEALANKATDFSVVNDTKYPTTKAVKDLVDAVSPIDLKSKYNFINFFEGMGDFNIDTDCNDETIYTNISNFGGTFPPDYDDGGFLIQTRYSGDEYDVQTLFSPVESKIYIRKVLGYDEADNPLWGEWKDPYGERSAFVQYQSISGWAKIAQIRLPEDNSQRESITFLVTTEDNTSTVSERYTGILELNTHENASSSALKWLVVSGFGLNNFNLRLNGNNLELWVLPTTGTMSFAVLSETMSGEDVRFIELFDVSESATRTGTSLGNSEKLNIQDITDILTGATSNATELRIANRSIKQVNAGVEDTDAVNVNQLNTAIGNLEVTIGNIDAILDSILGV